MDGFRSVLGVELAGLPVGLSGCVWTRGTRDLKRPLGLWLEQLEGDIAFYWEIKDWGASGHDGKGPGIFEEPQKEI